MIDMRTILINLKTWAQSERPIDHVVQAVEQGSASLKNRVFNSESGTKDVKGVGLGGYSDPYAKVRRKMGRQTAFVDLELTGALRREIKTVRDGSKVGIAIVAKTEREKANYLEQKYKRQIFEINEKEKDEIIETIKFNLSEDVKDIVNGNL